MTAGVPSDAIQAAVQSSIVAAGYGTRPTGPPTVTH
jgi:hypothetical protein